MSPAARPEACSSHCRMRLSPTVRPAFVGSWKAYPSRPICRRAVGDQRSEEAERTPQKTSLACLCGVSWADVGLRGGVFGPRSAVREE